MTTRLRSCDMNAIGDAANLWSAQALHGKCARNTLANSRSNMSFSSCYFLRWWSNT